MLSLAGKAADLLTRYLAVARDWGPSAASATVLGSRFRNGSGRFSLQPLGAEIHHRGRTDRPVLTQLGRDFGYIDPGAGSPIRTIVDAGANIGVFSMLARRLYPNAKIVAVEAAPRNFEVLKKNATALGNVLALHGALWSDSGTVDLALNDNPQANQVSQSGGAGTTPVPAFTVRDVMARGGLDTIDLLKMDIEGAESVVLGSLDDGTLDRINAIRFEGNDNDVPGNFLKSLARLVGSDFDGFVFDENVYLIRRRTGWIFQRRYAGIGDIPSFR